MTAKSKTAKTAAVKATANTKKSPGKKVIKAAAKKEVKVATAPSNSPVAVKAAVKKPVVAVKAVKAPVKKVTKPVAKKPVAAVKKVAAPTVKVDKTPVASVQTTSIPKVANFSIRSKLVPAGTMPAKPAANSSLSMASLIASVEKGQQAVAPMVQPKTVPAYEVKPPVHAPVPNRKAISVQDLFSTMTANATPSFIK